LYSRLENKISSAFFIFWPIKKRLFECGSGWKPENGRTEKPRYSRAQKSAMLICFCPLQPGFQSGGDVSRYKDILYFQTGSYRTGKSFKKKPAPFTRFGLITPKNQMKTIFYFISKKGGCLDWFTKIQKFFNRQNKKTIKILTVAFHSSALYAPDGVRLGVMRNYKKVIDESPMFNLSVIFTPVKVSPLTLAYSPDG